MLTRMNMCFSVALANEKLLSSVNVLRIHQTGSDQETLESLETF